MRIAICDDEKFDLDLLSSVIEKYSFEKDYDITVDVFEFPDLLLQSPKYDLYFIDYCFKETNGIEICKKLKEKYSYSTTVIFFTKYLAVAPECVNEVRPDGFLTKPIDKEKLCVLIDKFYKSSVISSDRIVLKRNKTYDTIYSQDILYVEAAGKSSVLFFEKSEEKYPYIISELEKNHLSPKLFVRTDRSYIVNMQHIQSFDKKIIILKDDSRVPLSRYEKFRDAYTNYLNKVIL